MKRAWDKIGVDMTRIENSVGSGTPDVNCCYNGEEFWVELKVAKSHKVDIKPSQVAWAKRRVEHDGAVYLLVKDQDTLILFEGNDVLDIARDRGNIAAVVPLFHTCSKEKDPWRRILEKVLDKRF